MASRVWLLSEWATVQRENGHDCFRPWMPAFAWSPMLVSARCQFMKAGDPGVGAGQWIEGIINGMSLWWCTSGGQWLARWVVFPHKGETSLRREAVNLGIRCVEQQGHLAPGATSLLGAPAGGMEPRCHADLVCETEELVFSHASNF